VAGTYRSCISYGLNVAMYVAFFKSNWKFIKPCNIKVLGPILWYHGMG